MVTGKEFKSPTEKQAMMFEELMLGDITNLTREEASDKISEGLRKRKEYKSQQHPGYGRKSRTYNTSAFDDDYGLGNFGDWGSH